MAIGINKKRQAERNNLWRRALKYKLDYCEACGARDMLHLHHICHRTKSNWAEPWNLMTLCLQCHKIVHCGKKVNGKFIGGQDALKAENPNRAGYLGARFEEAAIMAKGGK